MSSLEFRIRTPLRWRDMDMLGHLNQSVYHELIEEGRAGLMSEIAGRVTHTGGGAFVVAHVDLDYLTEVRKDHAAVDVVVSVERVGTSSLTLHHEVRHTDGTVAASGSAVIVGWDPATRSKRTLTEAERAALS